MLEDIQREAAGRHRAKSVREEDNSDFHLPQWTAQIRPVVDTSKPAS
jgi:hypothetical protein